MGSTIVLKKGVFGEALACSLVGTYLRPCSLVNGEDVAIFGSRDDAREAIIRFVDETRSKLIDNGYPARDMASREQWLAEYHLLTV